MEKIEKAEDRNHVMIHTNNTNSTSHFGEDDCNFIKTANSDDGTLRGDDEFCYEEDDFEEDHPFIPTRMTASCEGVYSIIGNNNGYHLHNGGSQSSSQRDIGELRAYAASMPHIASTSSLQKTMDFLNELKDKQEPFCQTPTGKSSQTKKDSLSCTISNHVPESSERYRMESQDLSKNTLEEECAEDGTLDLEFEYEPGISLSHMEFGRQAKPFQLFSKEALKEDKLDSGKLFRRKMSEMCTSSSGSISQRDRYQNMMLMTSSHTSDNLSTSLSESREGLDASTSNSNLSNKPQMMSPSRCTFCGVDYESGRCYILYVIIKILCSIYVVYSIISIITKKQLTVINDFMM